jgi:hypothetical protein
MSSATSTDDPGLRPWQFFLLAGMLAATGVVLVAAGQTPASIIVLSLTVVSASFVALGAYRSLAPLVNPAVVEPPQFIVGHTRAALEREKTLVLRAIKDLEFDFAMKKVAQHDFEEMSTRLRARALGLMHQLDSSGGYRDAIEREIAARLGRDVTANVAAVAGGTRAVTVAAATSDAIVCACGTANDHDARFCKNCGAKVAVA